MNEKQIATVTCMVVRLCRACIRHSHAIDRSWQRNIVQKYSVHSAINRSHVHRQTNSGLQFALAGIYYLLCEWPAMPGLSDEIVYNNIWNTAAHWMIYSHLFQINIIIIITHYGTIGVWYKFFSQFCACDVTVAAIIDLSFAIDFSFIICAPYERFRIGRHISFPFVFRYVLLAIFAVTLLVFFWFGLVDVRCVKVVHSIGHWLGSVRFFSPILLQTWKLLLFIYGWMIRVHA